MLVLGISGSLRRDSYNTALLRHAGDLFEAEGAEFEIYHGLRDIPPYDEDYDTEGAPDAVSRIREAVRDADAVFFVTPEYNSSIPGALKNTLDRLAPFAKSLNRLGRGRSHVHAKMHDKMQLCPRRFRFGTLMTRFTPGCVGGPPRRESACLSCCAPRRRAWPLAPASRPGSHRRVGARRPSERKMF